MSYTPPKTSDLFADLLDVPALTAGIGLPTTSRRTSPQESASYSLSEIEDDSQRWRTAASAVQVLCLCVWLPAVVVSALELFFPLP